MPPTSSSPSSSLSLPYFRVEYDKRDDREAYAALLNELRGKDGSDPQVLSSMRQCTGIG